MRIQGIDCFFDQQEWLQALQSAFKTESVQHQKHAYVYLNSKGKCNTFFSFSDALRKEFYCKLTIDDVIRVSQEHFNNYQQCQPDEVATLRYAFEVMDQGAQQTWWSRLVHWFRGLGFKDTHELIQEQLQWLAEHDVEIKYAQLREKLEKFKQIICLLNDDRFTQTCKDFSDQAQQWIQVYEDTPPQTYQDWKVQEENLTNLKLKIEQMIYLSQNISSLSDKQGQLNALLELHSQASIEKEKIDEIKQSLATLTRQVFDPFSIHDDDEYQQRFDALDAKLEEALSALLADESQAEDLFDNTVDPSSDTSLPLPIPPVQ